MSVVFLVAFAATTTASNANTSGGVVAPSQ
jgi:hypothetical protein